MTNDCGSPSFIFILCDIAEQEQINTYFYELNSCSRYFMNSKYLLKWEWCLSVFTTQKWSLLNFHLYYFCGLFICQGQRIPSLASLVFLLPSQVLPYFLGTYWLLWRAGSITLVFFRVLLVPEYRRALGTIWGMLIFVIKKDHNSATYYESS